MENIEIKDNDLELVVTEKTLGSLTTNAIQIRDLVKSNLSKYDIANYNDDNIDQAKKDKAALNKAAKSLNSKRIEIEKEFMKPFGEFKEVITETVKLIGDCSSKIDAVVKQNEQIYKEEKLSSIKSYYNENNSNLIDFNKVFKNEWLNKSTSLKSVCADIDSIFDKIEEEITSLQSYNEDFDVLSTYYRDTLNLSGTIQYANKLKEQRDRAKKAEEEKQRLQEERDKTIQESPKEVVEEKSNVVIPNTAPQKENPFDKYTKGPELLTRAFKVTTTRENIILLGEFMNEHGIDFDKIEL